LAAPQSETSVVHREVKVEATPEIVFPFFTDPELLVRWMGARATLDPRPGGRFGWDTMEGFLVEGTYLEVEPPRRVVFTWGWGGFPDEHGNPLPAGSSTVEVELVPEGNATVVKLTHRLPAQLADFHALGWEHYLGRLAEAAAGRDPGPDPMLDIATSMMAGD
jgi:uncharacterized protein YndB with AHSA1/START domain